MKYRIADIIVKDRKRDASDITALAESIKEIGLINAITIRPDGTLNTGLNRLEACKSLGWEEIEVNITELADLDAELAEIDENLIRNELNWIDRDKQLKRRKEIYEIKHPETKQGGDRRSILPQLTQSNRSHSGLIPSFTQDTSNKTGMSNTTIEQSVKRATAFTDEQMDLLKQAEVTQTEATQLARLREEERTEAIKALEQREIRREQAKERIEQLRAKGVELPKGKYSCIVIDPPWQMQKIERDVRPNQVEFDYPTMNEEELKAFPLPDMAGADCHLYLWTTQKHLPLALRLAEHWGFRYQCLLTWRKNVGFTPFSWMYSTEHVLFCRKGTLPLLKLGERLDFEGDFEGVGFNANVREHSRKPDEFYDLVKKVSPGPYLDVFSREQRDGFEQYGNEVEKYA